MTVKSVKATDYSTGKTYSYGDQTGDWGSIKSDGGKISGSGGSEAASVSSAAAAAPSVTDVSSGAPLPFDGTHKVSSAQSTPTGWPWVASATTLQTSTVQTTIPGLPSGWTVSDSGKVVPPSSASVSEPHPSACCPPMFIHKLTFSFFIVYIPTRLPLLLFACFAGGFFFV